MSFEDIDSKSISEEKRLKSDDSNSLNLVLVARERLYVKKNIEMSEMSEKYKYLILKE